MYCKDCVHWKYNSTECRIARESSDDDTLVNDEFGVFAIVYSSDNYGAETGLKTGPMFGCVKFEQKV